MILYEYLLRAYSLLIGASLASFLNVFVDRLPQRKSIMGRSYCDNCKKVIAWYDLIPILSYFLLAGKCRNCKAAIPLKHPLSELILGLIFVIFFPKLLISFDLSVLTSLILLCSVFVITMTDLDSQLIYDEPLYSIVLVGLILNFAELPFYLGGAILSSGFFLLIHYFSKGKAMGYADVKYVFVFGLVLPIHLQTLSLYVAFLTGGLVSVILLLTKQKKRDSQIAFGPFLSLGFLVGLYMML